MVNQNLALITAAFAGLWLLVSRGPEVGIAPQNGMVDGTPPGSGGSGSGSGSSSTGGGGSPVELERVTSVVANTPDMSPENRAARREAVDVAGDISANVSRNQIDVSGSGFDQSAFIGHSGL